MGRDRDSHAENSELFSFNVGFFCGEHFENPLTLRHSGHQLFCHQHQSVRFLTLTFQCHSSHCNHYRTCHQLFSHSSPECFFSRKPSQNVLFRHSFYTLHYMLGIPDASVAFQNGCICHSHGIFFSCYLIENFVPLIDLFFASGLGFYLNSSGPFCIESSLPH